MITTIRARNATTATQDISFNTLNDSTILKTKEVIKNFQMSVRKEVKHSFRKTIRLELTKIKETFELTFKRVSGSKLLVGINIFPWLNTTGIPPEFLDLASSTVLLLMGLVVVMAIINSLLASLLTMCNKEKEGERWLGNIRRGLIQALTATIIIIILCSLADFMFSGIGGYTPVTKLK